MAPTAMRFLRAASEFPSMIFVLSWNDLATSFSAWLALSIASSEPRSAPLSSFHTSVKASPLLIASSRLPTRILASACADAKPLARPVFAEAAFAAAVSYLANSALIWSVV
jgi:hypothetical protein